MSSRDSLLLLVVFLGCAAAIWVADAAAKPELVDGGALTFVMVGSGPTRLVIWAGGETGGPVAAHAGVSQGRGGRIDVDPDLTVPGFPALYAVGDIANVPSPAGGTLPQLSSVAQQAGDWAARNILAGLEGGVRQGFHYDELHGRLTFAAWLGVHAELKAFLPWANERYLPPHHRSAELLDPGQVDTPRIDWSAS